jgi:hypothetical protein
MERDKIRVAHGLGGKLERRLDIVSGDLRVGFDELLERVAVGDTSPERNQWNRARYNEDQMCTRNYKWRPFAKILAAAFPDPASAKK